MGRTITTTALVALLLLLSALPAAAEPAEEARAEAWGAQVTGAADLGPLPEGVTATLPPGEQASDSVVDVPAEPLVLSATLRGEAEARRDAVADARLQAVADDAAAAPLPTAWNAGAHAVVEDLAALFAEEDDPQLTAEVVEAEAVAACVAGNPVFGTATRVQRLRLAGEEAPVLGEVLDTATELVVQGEPNEDVLANVAGGEALAELGLAITAWETNWDGATGTTDGADTVWANALRISVAEGSPLGDAVGAQEVTVSHSEASVDCDAPVEPAEQPREALPVTGGGPALLAALGLLAAGGVVVLVRRWAA